MQNIIQKYKRDTQPEQELERLRLQLWRAKGRYSRRLSVVMLLISATLLVLSYFTRYITFEVTSIIALLIGAILMIENLDPQVKIRSASQALLSMLMILIDLKRKFGVSGKGLFIAIKSNNVKLIVLKENEFDQSILLKLKNERTLSENDGLLIPSPGQGLYQLYEEELGEINGMNLSYLFEWLPRVIVDGLNLCEKTHMFLVNEEVHTVFTKPFIRTVCQRRNIREDICRSIGCPLTSSIAHTLALATDLPIHHIECRYDPIGQKAYSVHRFNGLKE